MENSKSIENSVGSLIIDTKGRPMPDNNSIVIFIVDDDLLYLKALENQFKQNLNLTVKTFSTGEACIENLKLKPDIIILDYFLDTVKKDAIDGLHTLIEIKKISPGTQVIMSSSHECTEVTVNCIKHGAFDYIVKNNQTFSRLKKAIKKAFSISNKVKELIVWDW